MLDEIDAVIGRSDLQMVDEELFRRAKILDGFYRTPSQEAEMVEILKPQIRGCAVSQESMIGFISDKLAGLFGNYGNGPSPDPVLLATKTKQFLREVQQTYGNNRWIENRTFVEGEISIGALSREWMVGDIVCVTVTNYLEPITEAIERDLDIHGAQISNYLQALRVLSEVMYKLDPQSAVESVADFKRKRPMPATPTPIHVQYLGNYRVGKMGQWWSLDVHPNTPVPPKMIDHLTPQYLAIAGKDLVNLLTWLIRYEEKYNRFNFTLPDREAIFQEEAKRKWWEWASETLGKTKAEALWDTFNPYAVLPLTMGLIPHYRSIGYRYAKAMYARMQASIK